MNEQNIVVTVRLSDVDENDQPDPICLPCRELTTWRHFETLLLNMFQNPPPAIRVCYLDDDSDWIEVSSDAELREAIRITQETDEILQLQVKRKDVPERTYYESTLSSRSGSLVSDDPCVTPIHTMYYNKANSQCLIYPHPTDNINGSSIASAPPEPLVYPHPQTNNLYPHTQPHPDPEQNTTGHSPLDRPNENVLVLQANGKAAYMQNRPDLSTEEKVQRLKARLTGHKETDDEKMKGLNKFVSNQHVWQQASKYSSEDKLKFMKTIVSGDCGTGMEKVKQMGSEVKVKTQQTEKPNESIQVKQGLLIEPLVIEPVTNSTRLTVQDPFEVMSQDKPSRDLEEIQLNLQANNILQPQKPGNITQKKTPPTNSDKGDMFNCLTAVVNVQRVEEQVHSTSKPSVVESDGGGKEKTSGRPSSASLVETIPPVPLPRTLQMMEGAQSGANAVAIEMPEGDHHGAAQKEEDVTASGGTSCTSASAETGEAINNRHSPEGGAVGHKIKAALIRPSSNTFQPSGPPPNSRSTSKKNKKIDPAKSVESAAANKNKKDTLQKEVGGTPLSSSSNSNKRKVSSSSQEKKRSRDKSLSSNNTKGTVKVEADVESGEKIVKLKTRDNNVQYLQYQDFVKVMTKVKKELHANIVKDVERQTDKLLKKTLSRSQSCSGSHHRQINCEEVVHKGIYCDSCNSRILGIRFKCGNCPDFDLCEKCEATPNIHNPRHVFLKLRRPIYGAGRIGKETVPLLQEIIYKDADDAIAKERKPKAQSLEDVPILSISEVTTPKVRQSPPSTPPESYRKIDISNWVWDSAFDTDQKNLYPMEGEALAQTDGSFNPLTVCQEKMKEQRNLDETEINRLVALLSMEAEAAKKVEESMATVDEGTYQIEVPTSMPLLASGTNMGGEESEMTRKTCEDLQEEGEGETDIMMQDGASSQVSGELVDAEEDFIEEEEEAEENESFEDLEVTCEFPDVEVDADEVNESEGELVQESPSSQQGHDSDTSDDFCILDPPTWDEQEVVAQECSMTHQSVDECQGNTGMEHIHHVTDVPSMEMVEHVRAEGEALNAIDVTDISEDRVEDDEEVLVNDASCKDGLNIRSSYVEKRNDVHQQEEEENKTESVKEEETGDETQKEMGMAAGYGEKEEETSLGEGMNDGDADVLMKMSVEERRRFLDSVKNLKDRAEDLENELKVRKEDEARKQQALEEELLFQTILEEKQREAVMENEKLEQQKKKEQEEKRKRQMERERKAKTRQNVSCVNGKVGRYSLSGTPTLMEMALNAKETKTVVDCGSDAGTSVVTPRADVPTATTKDADCQTTARVMGGGADAAAQASQMIHHVASGVSKAAGAAYHTAKDVFYSLQAKQVEKKSNEGIVLSTAPSKKTSESKQDVVLTLPSSVWTPPANTYVPPNSDWIPPKSDWKPTKSEWTPPKSEWAPPKSEWTGPKSEWKPPAGFYQPPNQVLETSAATAACVINTFGSETLLSQHNNDARGSNEPTTPRTGDQKKVENRRKSTDQNTCIAVPGGHLPTLTPIEIVDPVLRREVQGMQTLIEMGFANREENRRLLQKYNGDVEQAVQKLLQEERDEHWAWQRH